jgi:hypothetical protein
VIEDGGDVIFINKLSGPDQKSFRLPMGKYWKIKKEYTRIIIRVQRRWLAGGYGWMRIVSSRTLRSLPFFFLCYPFPEQILFTVADIRVFYYCMPNPVNIGWS